MALLLLQHGARSPAELRRTEFETVEPPASLLAEREARVPLLLGW
jgi:hypothetical protein